MVSQELLKFDMSLSDNKVNDINLYIYDEKNICTKKHTHSFFELIIITQGQIDQKINGKQYTMLKNDICILRPEAIHEISLQNTSNLLLFNFEISIEYLSLLCRTLGYNSCDDIFQSVCTYIRCPQEEITNYLNIITFPNKTTSYLHYANKQSSLKIVITTILTKILSRQTFYFSTSTTDPIVTTILSYLGNSDYFQLSIKEICEKSFYTQEHITRLFAKAKLDKPSKIHLQKKLHYAAYLLLNTDLKIIDIAEQCGIKTISYFNKAFKSEYGIPPFAYKKTYMPNIQQKNNERVN